jgi:ABC-type branched-subunit amino acid transport system substrate-binding protein
LKLSVFIKKRALNVSESPTPAIPPKSPQRRTLLAAAGLSMLAAPWVARAQPSTLRIAATIAETGVERFNGMGLLQGASALFDAINRSGGIHGRKIELIKADDEFNASKAQANALGFAADPSVLALIHPQGTRQTGEIMKAVHDLPIVGPNTGATALHKSGAKNVFWVRTNYDQEVERLVKLADNLGLKRFGLVYPNDPFGQSVLQSFQAALARRNIEAVGVASTPGTASLEVDAAARKLAALPVQVLIMSLAGTAPAFYQAYRAAGGVSLCYGLSVSGTAANLAKLSKGNDRPFFSVIVPSPNAQKFELVRQYRRDMKAAGFEAESLVSLEGYVDAYVLAEGLRRAGPKVDRDSLMAGLESLSNFDIGGLRLNFGKNAREGNTYTDTVTVDGTGRLIS